MYVKLPPKNLNPGPTPQTPHKHLYLWNSHCTKGVQLSFDAQRC